MQEQNLTSLLAGIHDLKKDPFLNKPAELKKSMTALAQKNKDDLSSKEMPDYLRTPTAEELIEMRQWAIDYKKRNKNASKREVRKATQAHFRIRIFR